MDKLYIVIPAYNEAANLESVVRAWHQVAQTVGGGSRLLVVDDGSRDETPAILRRLQTELPRLLVHTKPNGGHGPAVRLGYRLALEGGADYMFQTDSDGQTRPEEFWPLWDGRRRYAYQIGRRRHRRDGAGRSLVSLGLRLVLLCSFGTWLPDANTPFRLMEASSLARLLPWVPEDCPLPNALLAALYRKSGLPGRFPDITFLPRQGGRNHIHLPQIVRLGLGALGDFRRLRRTIPIFGGRGRP